MTIKEIISLLSKKGFKPTPCSPMEVETVEKLISAPLPSIYREFLLAMGKDAGPIMQGSDAFFPEILSLNKAAVELLAENQPPLTLPPDAFVFNMHQGYQFLFFRLHEGDNPPVYHYMEHDTEFELSSATLTEFLEKTTWPLNEK